RRDDGAHTRRALAAAVVRTPHDRALPAGGEPADHRAVVGLGAEAAARALRRRAPCRGRGRARPTRRHARGRRHRRGRSRGAERARVRDRRQLAAVKARLASGNRHKRDELRAALPGWELDLVDVDVEENGATYEDNARLKALAGRAATPAEAWVLGEDSGIECDALAGGP